MSAKLAQALHAFQKDAPPIHLDATNPQPRNRNRQALSECPDCGRLKMLKAKRCKPCNDAFQRGTHRTETPSRSTGWRRARAAPRPLPHACEYAECDQAGVDHHHIDGDPLNNELGNIAIYCRRHHMLVDGRLAASAERAARVGREFGGRKPRAA